MNPIEAVPCPRCGALAGIVAYIAGGANLHQAICRTSDGGCGLHLHRFATAVEAEADWRRRAVEAAIRRDQKTKREQDRWRRFRWTQDPIVIAMVIEHYECFGGRLHVHGAYPNGAVAPCGCNGRIANHPPGRIFWGPDDAGNPRGLRMDAQAFYERVLVPLFNLIPSPWGSGQVNTILHGAGYPVYHAPGRGPRGAGRRGRPQLPKMEPIT